MRGLRGDVFVISTIKMGDVEGEIKSLEMMFDSGI